MNRYSNLSDCEINELIVSAINRQVFKNEDKIYLAVRLRTVTELDFIQFDPCNNPADAMQIIIENGISSTFNNGEWICTISNGEILSFNKNLYRAAMEVFLMMKDIENDTINT